MYICMYVYIYTHIHIPCDGKLKTCVHVKTEKPPSRRQFRRSALISKSEANAMHAGGLSQT